MKVYHDALEYVIKNGEDRLDRTGIGTRSVFGYQMRFDLQEGFPAVTTKKLAWKSVVSELLWFLEGSTDERRLAEILHGKSREQIIEKNTIWTANADKQGKALGYTNTDIHKDLGPVYGKQWRSWDIGSKSESIDQIKNVIEQIKNDPFNRRHIVSAWNVSDIDKMALPPCHMIFQFYVSNHGKLSCHMYQRSCDLFLGVPFNIASYALLTHMISQVCDLTAKEFILTCGDAHIYNNHFNQVSQQLSRELRPLPSLVLNPKINDIDSFSMNDIMLNDYNSHGPIKADMAV